MVYRYLGKSGLKVSVMGFGNMMNFKEGNEATDLELIKVCLQNGVNFFDTAEMYGEGKAERALGSQLRQLGVRREDIVISTKIWIGENPEINSNGTTNRKHVKEGIKASLSRLQLDYVDIYYAHAFDEKTSVEETCRAFHDIIEDGLTFYWGTSNWQIGQIYEAFAICDRLGLHKPVAAENQYSLLCRRQMEVEYLRLFKNHGYGITCYSPLAGGFLTGKYLNGLPTTENRFNSKVSFDPDSLKKLFYDPYNNEKTIESLKALKVIAEELGGTMAQVALAWVMKYQYLSSAIVGARSLEQLNDLLGSINILPKLTPEVESRITALFGPLDTGLDELERVQFPAIRQ